ncbi:MAG TPA: hypothetical protein VMA75_03345 [Candidatus Paceibacterota bacterium]|nr:hypothetical protein [Candidatus Paceibacterota bacterium]
MELFSKRYSAKGPRNDVILSDTLRKRLEQELKFITSSKDYIEAFLLVDNEKENKIYLHSLTLRDLSSRELGYDLTSLVYCKTMDFNANPDDNQLLDLIELLIIFCKEINRKELIERLQNIFKEEGDQFIIHNFIIFKKDETGLKSLVPLIKDKNLQVKLEEYFTEASRGSKPNYEMLARIAADIVQILFSAPKQKETKKYSEQLCSDIAYKWTDKKNAQALAILLSETVKNAKELSNQISNIRHTDRSTIPVRTPSLYRLIALKNSSIAEVVILSLPENYILDQNPEEIKNHYLGKYNLKADNGWLVEDEIKPEDIPF